MHTDALRAANRARLPLFKNSKGEPAHSTSDGHDWSPAQWLQAVIGELGELCRVRIDYEEGVISEEQYKEAVGKETADVVIYLDIFLQRCLDKLTPAQSHTPRSPAQLLMHAMANLGDYANARKKLDRGDYDAAVFMPIKNARLTEAADFIYAIRGSFATLKMPHADVVLTADPHGLDLGEVVIHKFNETSDKIGVDVHISTGEEHF